MKTIYLTDQNIEKAVSNLVSKNQAPIVRHYDGYIILAQDEHDFQTKVSKIQRGDTVGFYTVERALSFKKELLKPEHLGDGVYIHDEGYGIDLAVNHHENKVISMGEYEIKAFIEYVKRAGYLKED